MGMNKRLHIKILLYIVCHYACFYINGEVVNKNLLIRNNLMLLKYMLFGYGTFIID